MIVVVFPSEACIPVDIIHKATEESFITIEGHFFFLQNLLLQEIVIVVCLLIFQ